MKQKHENRIFTQMMYQCIEKPNSITLASSELAPN